MSRAVWVLFAIVVAVGLSRTTSTVLQDFWDERTKILLLERSESLGGNVIMTDQEREANRTLMKYKALEWEDGFRRPGEYPPNQHFFHSKRAIDRSKMFQIIKELPKGVLLHTHDFGMLSFESLMKLTYIENLFVCDDSAQNLTFHFFKSPPSSSCSSGWQLLADLRKETGKNIDERIRSTLSLVVDDPYSTYQCINDVWDKFQTIFIKVGPIVTFKPVFDLYVYNSLKELYDDNIHYVQIRTTLPDLYDLDGTIYKGAQVVAAFKNAAEKFMSDYPTFVGVKVIYAPPRHVTIETMQHYVETFYAIKAKYNDFVLGFDLVGQEDKGAPLKDFLKYLLLLKNTTEFFFHAGETNWYGSATDENLVDAILLGTKRIGHGYALLKHPELIKLVRERGILLEVSPISNQVLKLVDDVRNHPGAIYGSMALPMVITNDDPSYWDAKGVSYDWYMAFMGMASEHSDLGYLKMMALNSINYSGIDKDDLAQLMSAWTAAWEVFVRKLANDDIY